MKKLTKTEVFSGLDSNKDETLIRSGRQRSVVNFSIDDTLGSLVKIQGTDIVYRIDNIEKIKGAHFFEFDYYNDDTDSNFEYKYLIAAAEKNINDVITDVLIIINLAEITTNIINADDWIRNISGYSLFDSFFSDSEIKLKESSKVNKYFFISIDNELWINNRVQPPFRFYIDLAETDEVKRKKGLFSFITIPTFLSPSQDSEYNLIIKKNIILKGGLEVGKYSYQYTYYDKINKIESIPHNIISSFNTGIKCEILTPNEDFEDYVQIYHAHIWPDVFFFRNLKIVTQYKSFLKAIDIPYNTLSYYLKIKVFYSTNDWKTVCNEYLEIEYKNNDVGVLLYHNIELQEDTPAPIETGPIIPIEFPFAYITLSENEYKKNICHKKKITTLKTTDIIIPLPSGDIRAPHHIYFGDCEILILDEEINQKENFEYYASYSSNLNVTTFNNINNKSIHPYIPLYGVDIEKKTEIQNSEQIIYQNTYNGADYLADTDDYKDYLMHFRETPENRNPEDFYEKVLSNTFYSLVTDPFRDMPLAGDVFEILITKLEITIPFNNKISKTSNISSIRVYRNNLVSGIPTDNFFLDKQLEIESENGFIKTDGNISQYWVKDIVYISETKDLTIAMNSESDFKEGLITLNKTYQLLLHKNRIAALDNSRLLIRYSELTPNLNDFYDTSYYSFKTSDGGKIVSIVPFSDNWIVLLDKNQFIIENVSRNDDGNIIIDDRTVGDNRNGCLAEGSIQITPSGVIYASNDGFRRTDSYNVSSIDAIEKKYINYYKKIDWSKADKIQSWTNNEKYYCYVILKSENDKLAESIIFVYHLSLNEWTIIKDFNIEILLNSRLSDNNIYFSDKNYIKRFSDNNAIFIDSGEFSTADYNMPVSDEFYAQDNNKDWQNNQLNGCYLYIYNKADNTLDAVYTINRNIFDVIYINEKVSGFDLYPNDPSQWGQLKGSSGKYYKIFKQIKSYIETPSFDFGIIEYCKSMTAMEIFFKAGIISGKLSIYYSIDEGDYQSLCETKAISAAGFGMGEYSQSGIGGYFNDGKTDFYCRIGRIPFRKIQRFNIIKFKIEHSGIDNFELRKIIYHYNVHPVRRNVTLTSSY